MPSDGVTEPWAMRSTLIAVADLERSIAFYREIGPFEEIAREDGAAVLGGVMPASIVLLLREMRSMHHARHGQQSLGLRSIAFNVGSLGELNRVESVLRDRDLFTARQRIAEGESELVRGRDPDNLPLVFMCYADDKPLGPEYYEAVADLVFSLDI
jgi:hypothetical protein